MLLEKAEALSVYWNYWVSTQCITSGLARVFEFCHKNFFFIEKTRKLMQIWFAEILVLRGDTVLLTMNVVDTEDHQYRIYWRCIGWTRGTTDFV